MNKNNRKKITVVGAGHVGETCAYLAAAKELGDVVMVDIVEGRPQGLALDMMQSGAVSAFTSNITGTNDYADTANSDIVVITAGFPRKPGMSRDDLLQSNYNIMSSIAPEIAKHSPDAFVIIVSNPLDIMVSAFFEISGFPKNRVMGMAGILDTARYNTFIAMETGVSVENVSSIVLGGHGDSMVPLISSTTVCGLPVTELIPGDRLDAIVERTRKGGAEIVGLLKTGSAYYAPGAAAAQMVEAIARDQRKILPVAARLEGEYGVKGMFIGVPAILGANGMEKVVEVDLNESEKEMFSNSVSHVEAVMKEMGNLKANSKK